MRTPHLTELARSGTVFDRHFCVYPVCTPSRYSLLTGLYPHQHLGWNNHCTLPAGLPVLPRLLREAGYRTAAVGKMHFTPTFLDVGFERMTLAEQDGDGRFDDQYHRELMEAGLIDDEDLIDQRTEYRVHAPQSYFDCFGAQASSLPEPWHSTRWITDRAIDEIARWEPGQSHFLMTGYIKPHHPFDPPARYAELYCPEHIRPLPGYTESVPPQDSSLSRGYFDNASLTLPRLQRMMAYYYAAITQIDDGIGEIVRLLHERNLLSETMIVFTSDHGDYLGFHHMALKSNHLYDPLMHIPLIIRYPGDMHSGEHVTTLSSNVDVAAEILRVCGVSPAAGMEQEDLFSGRRVVLGEQLIRDAHHYMIRSDAYKVLLTGSSREGMLFDLREDPAELHNLWNEPFCRDLRQRYTSQLLESLAFASCSVIHLDENAPVNSPENGTNPLRRDEMRAYLKRASRLGSLVQN